MTSQASSFSRPFCFYFNATLKDLYAIDSMHDGRFHATPPADAKRDALRRPPRVPSARQAAPAALPDDPHVLRTLSYPTRRLDRRRSPRSQPGRPSPAAPAAPRLYTAPPTYAYRAARSRMPRGRIPLGRMPLGRMPRSRTPTAPPSAPFPSPPFVAPRRCQSPCSSRWRRGVSP